MDNRSENSGNYDLEKLQFEDKVLQLLGAVGFDRTKEAMGRINSASTVLTQLIDWGIIRYEKGLKLTPLFFEKHLALLLQSPSQKDHVVCLYGERDRAIAASFIPHEGITNEELRTTGQAARIDYIRLYPNDEYKTGAITVTEEVNGFRGGYSFNDPEPKKIHDPIDSSILEERLIQLIRGKAR